MPTDRDGIYIEGVLVSTAEDMALTFQANDLTKPAQLQSSHSNSFNLPDSLAVRQLTQHAEQLDSGSKYPYRPLPARVINRGETTFEGFAEFSEFDNGWETLLYEEKLSLFDKLDRSLRSLQLSYLDHLWTLEQINQHEAATDGICYPLIDYGLLSNNVLPYDVLFPAVFVKTLLAQMLQEEGYTLVGDILDDELFKRMIITFSEEEPTSHDEDWKNDRFANVTLSIPDDSVRRGALGSGNFIDRIQPYSIDNIDQFYQGKLHPFNTTTNEYVCPDAMHVQVQCTQIFKVSCQSGGVEVILSVEKNGTQVASKRFEEGTGYNFLFIRPDTLTLDETITCKAGDRLRIRLEARRFTDLGAFHFEVYNNSENSFCSFTPKLTTAFGDAWNTARNLPDMQCLDLVKTVAYALEGIWLVDARKKQVSLSSLTAITSNTDNAVDWSERIAGEEVKWSPRLPPYAQNNLLAWKETPESKAAATMQAGNPLNYGDGIIEVDAPVLDNLVTLFTMPFGASTDSAQVLPDYGSPVLVKIRSVSGTGTNLSITNQATTPRLLLVTLGDAVSVQTSQLLDDGTIQPVTVNLKPCWFGMRPYPVLATQPALTLSFGRLGIGRGELCLIEKYYAGLSRVLRRMRVLTLTMYLKPTHIANLDFRKPVRLRRVVVGPLVLSDGFYILNKVDGYGESGLCTVTLIAF